MIGRLLIIHFGPPMCAQRHYCVQSALELYHDLEPWLITDDTVVWWMICMLRRLHLDQEPAAWDRFTLMGRVLTSDWLRAYLLSTHRNMLYADTDVLHLRRFKLDPDSTVPYIMGPPADSAMMYSANACDYWQRLLDEKIRRQDWGNPQDAMSGGDGIPISREYYRHYGASENQAMAEDRHWWAS